MKNENIVLEKSYQFALRTVKLYKFLTEKKEYILSKQILRSGTSIGANLEEAVGGQSKKDFLAKMFIAYKETRETRFWIRLLRDSKSITAEEASSLLENCEELAKIIGKIIQATKSNLKK